MKLLFDENLSPRLATLVSNLYPDSTHVHNCGLGSSDDEAIWAYAKLHGFTIVSKDSDFQERSVLRGFPPKLIWIRAANCTTLDIENLLKTASSIIARFIQQDAESCLVLSAPSKTR